MCTPPNIAHNRAPKEGEPYRDEVMARVEKVTQVLGEADNSYTCSHAVREKIFSAAQTERIREKGPSASQVRLDWDPWL